MEPIGEFIFKGVLIMEKKLFKTLISNEKNDYVIGKISGILYALCSCNPKEVYAMGVFDTGYLHYVECTEKQYSKAKKVIEDLYPGVCTFDEYIL